MEALRVYLRGEAIKWVGDSAVRQDLLKLDEWSLVSTTTDDTPQQNNGSDCGAFTCTFAKYVDEGRAMNFTCDDMKQIRMDVTCSLLHCHGSVRLKRPVFSSLCGMQEMSSVSCGSRPLPMLEMTRQSMS